MTADLERRLVLAQTAHNLELLENDKLTADLAKANSRLAAADKKHYADLVETNREWIAETEVVSQRLAAAEAEAREWANRANELAFKLAAAERVVAAARVVAEDYGGRLTGPEEHLVVALKATEAYTGVPGVLSSDGKPARGDHPRQYVTPSRESPDVIAVSDGSTTGTADLKQDCLCCNDAGCLCCKRTDLNSEKPNG